MPKKIPVFEVLKKMKKKGETKNLSKFKTGSRYQMMTDRIQIKMW